MKKKLTINDIAKLSGVGKSTVSRYFNEGYVKEETREKIRKVIETYDYRPNQFAASLKAKESKLIGVIAPCFDSTITSRILMSIDEKLISEGYRSIVVNTNHSIERELASINRLWQMNVDGIILLATKVTQEHREMLNRIGIPFVFVGQDVDGHVSIINDDYNAGYDAGTIIGQSAPQNVLIVSVNIDDVAIGKYRKEGIIAGLKSQGVSNYEVIESDFSFDKTRDAIAYQLNQEEYDAIICSTDRMAMAAFNELNRRNKKIPSDVSLIGFGGYDISALLTPSITTFRFESEYAGELAVETIINMIKGGAAQQSQVIGYKCIIGESVKK